MKIKIVIYATKFCQLCLPYIKDVFEKCKKNKYECELIYIEDNPLFALRDLIAARSIGAVIQHAPFMLIIDENNPDHNFKEAIGGLLSTDKINEILDKYV